MTITSTSLFKLDYGGKIEREIARMISKFEESNFDTGRYSQRWLAIKLLEKDPDILERVQSMQSGETIVAYARERAAHVEAMLGEDFDLLTADRRYGYINGIVRQTLHRPLVDRITFTDRVDNVVIDIGASNVEDLLKLMRRYRDSQQDFDGFIVPTVPTRKQQQDTAATLTELARIGVPPERLRLVFNQVDDDSPIDRTFDTLLAYCA